MNAQPGVCKFYTRRFFFAKFALIIKVRTRKGKHNGFS